MAGWGLFTFVGGTVLATNVCRAADWFQMLSYQHRMWPKSVTTVRVGGAIFSVAGAVALLRAW
ncbi:hypothetical protein [Streptomyces formicae]|uniref:Uncharacterized protein n=1 Tax=Streptomyces formicae TaxID=1616117 RepID=A0A291Q9F9_9ACTN|nr:hypothetical protein [Streptomyces formicae]ATL28115.1 hypothetical protein KY5_3097c [Streptomyces formicae]